MALIIFLIFISILLCTHSQVSYELVCEVSYECRYMTVDCPPYQFCKIICSALDQACTEMVINCPSGYQCLLQCSGSNSCSGVIMNCNSGNCDISCSGVGSCNSATINGGHSNAITMQCIQSNACESIVIHCSDSDTQQNIQCNANSACRYAKIYGAANTRLQVNCQEDYACDRITIDASNTNNLVLSDCITGASTCRGITVYCPPNIGGTPQCTINGDEGLFGTATYPLTFYAINGFQDIEFITGQKSDNDYFGTMFCASNYSSSCSISTSGWLCDPTGNVKCNDPQTTNSPTANPTYILSIYPTHIPTLNPTYIPTVSTTLHPFSQTVTSQPTMIPSLYPISTYRPTNIPSFTALSKQPTLYVPGSGSTTKLYPFRSTYTTETKRTEYEKEDKNNFNSDMFEPVTLILIMILTIIVLCFFLCICCIKQLRKDKTVQKSYGANIELPTNYVTKSTDEMQPQHLVENIESRTNTLWSDNDKVFQSDTAYKTGEILVENELNDDEVINDDSVDYDNVLTHGSNGNNNKQKTVGNNNIYIDEIVIEGDDDGDITPSDDFDSVKQNNQNYQDEEYIMESNNSELSNHHNHANFDKIRLQNQRCTSKSK